MVSLLLPLLATSFGARAQCSNYTVYVGGGFYDYEISWQLLDDQGFVVGSGFAPQTLIYCLEPGCYTMVMYDDWGDGWNGAFFNFNLNGVTVASGTLDSGSYGTLELELGGGSCSPGGGGDCGYNLYVGGGFFDAEISWSLVNELGMNISSGFAPVNVSLCLEPGCYTLNMYDSWGDGWNNAAAQLYDPNGNLVGTASLASGSYGTGVFQVGGADCGIQEAVTASDCNDAIYVCEDLDFTVDPNGYGLVNEVPPLGSLANPDYGVFQYNPWGTFNFGCLRVGELNSTWMIVNIAGSGDLEFTFGGLGMQAGFYDWAMWSYDPGTCGNIFNNLQAPVRCNWNGVAFGGTGLASVLPPGADWTNFEPPLYVYAGEQYLICFSNYSSVSTVVPLQFGGTAIVACEPLLLPVELTRFEAESGLNRILLEWETASETNNMGYSIERSWDLKHWSGIGEVAGAGTVAVSSLYSFVDDDPREGINYYRLVQTDFNGDTQRSEVVAATNYAAGEPLVFPNPSNGTFSLRLAGAQLSRIVSFSGKEVSYKLEMHGEELAQIALTSPEPGLYALLLVYQGRQQWLPLLVQ